MSYEPEIRAASGRYTWRRHWLVLIILVLSWLPIWWLDTLLLGPRPGGWISLDLRGVLVLPVVGASLLFAASSTLVIAVRRPGRDPLRLVYSLVGGLIILAAMIGALILYCIETSAPGGG